MPLEPTALTAVGADGANRIAQAGGTSYGFDAEGQTATKAEPGGATQYGWDGRGRLTRATLPNGQAVTYGYDALGRRANRSSGGATTTFLYDGADVVLDNGSDGGSVDYINGPGIDDKLRQTTSSSPLYFLQDHLGSTIALTDGSGAAVERQRYEPFGKSSERESGQMASHSRVIQS